VAEQAPAVGQVMVARRGGRGFWGKYGVPYLYISPFYILWAIFGAFPIAYSLFLAFHFWNGLAENPKIWVGLENFVDVLKDKGWFWKATSASSRTFRC
jgi:ABC-type sugar transport system permease subunit